MEHLYTIPSVTYVEERESLSRVAVSATVYLTTSETFDHTFTRPEYDIESPMGPTGPTMVEVTEPKTVDHFQHFTVDFDTSLLDPLTFTEWEELTEPQVLEWVKEAAATKIAEAEAEGEDVVAEKKDRILNPKKYRFDTPPTPWRVKADQEAAEAMATNGEG